MAIPIVKLLTRPGCCACDQAKFVIRRLKQTLTFEAKVVNILKESQYKIYNDELPVVLVNEVAICRTKIIENDLRLAIIS